MKNLMQTTSYFFILASLALTLNFCKAVSSSSSSGKADAASSIQIKFTPEDTGLISFNVLTSSKLVVKLVTLKIIPTAAVTKAVAINQDVIEFDAVPHFAAGATVALKPSDVTCANADFTLDNSPTELKCTGPLVENGKPPEQASLDCECVADYEDKGQSLSRKLSFKVKTEGECLALRKSQRDDIDQFTYILSRCALKSISLDTTESETIKCACDAFDNKIKGDSGRKLLFNAMQGSSCENLNSTLQFSASKYYLVYGCKALTGDTQGQANPPNPENPSSKVSCSCVAKSMSEQGFEMPVIVPKDGTKECRALDKTYHWDNEDRYLLSNCK